MDELELINPYLLAAPSRWPWYLGLAAVIVLALALGSWLGRRRRLGLVLVILGLGLGATALILQSPRRWRPIVFSERSMLRELWTSYKQEYLEPGTGRTIDKQRNNITTSESQAYTMLRAVWMDDKTVFDQSWQWTRDNLQRPDQLFAWLFGEQANGRFGILTEQNGNNTASDADTDIAVALLFAYARWQEPGYLAAASQIIPAIWNTEVVTVQDQPYLAANNVEKRAGGPSVLLNPSYFAPYAYRMFAQVDPGHPWLELVTTAYEVIERSSELPLGDQSPSGLPPDWVRLERVTGRLVPPTAASDLNLTTNYGYDALRIPWRLSLDALWYQEPRAREALKRFRALGEAWQQTGRLVATYTHAGTPAADFEAPAMYGGSLGYFLLIDPAQAEKLYQEKLLYLYNVDYTGWLTKLSYYDDNLAWFGLALYHRALPNLHQLNFR